MRPVVLLTGGTSGIGRATAAALQEKGCKVYSCARRPSPFSDVEHICADVTDTAQVQAMVDAIMEKEGRIDIVVNAAGFGISGAVEYTNTEDAKKLMNVNFFGMVTVNRAILPIMHRQCKGRIVNISSVASPIAIPFQTYYSASKAAIDAYTKALANEVRPYGITVCSVLPGDIATGFTAAREKSAEGDTEYGGRISRSVATMEHDEQTGMKPEVAGNYIAKVALKKSHKPSYSIGFQYKLFCVIVKILPARLCNYLVGMIYGK